jgi:hypothetical protein
VVLSIQRWSLHATELDDIFSMIMQVLSIFSKLSSMPQIGVMSLQYWLLRHFESFGPFSS